MSKPCTWPRCSVTCGRKSRPPSTCHTLDSLTVPATIETTHQQAGAVTVHLQECRKHTYKAGIFPQGLCTPHWADHQEASFSAHGSPAPCLQMKAQPQC